MTITSKQASDEWCVARCIFMLAEYLSERQRGQILARIRHFGDAGACVRALIDISNVFPEPLAGEIRQEAFAAAQRIESHWLRNRALVRVAVRVPEYRTQALTEALSAVEKIHNDFHRGRALSGMAGLLPNELIDQAVELAHSISDDSSRTACLAFLACYLSDDERIDVLEALPKIRDGSLRTYTLIALAEFIPVQSMDKVLEYARSLSEPEELAQALAGLAPNFPDEQHIIEHQALSAAHRITNPYTRTEVIGDLASSLPESERSSLIQKEMIAARASGDVIFQALTLKTLSQYLSADDRPAVMQEIVQSARAIEDNSLRAEVLASLLAEIPEADRTDLILEIFAALELTPGSKSFD